MQGTRNVPVFSFSLSGGPTVSEGRPFVGALLLFVVTLLVFSPVLTHHFVLSWDDRTAILTNPDYNPPRLGKLVHYWTRPPAGGLFYVPITYTIWGLLAMVARGSAPAGVPFDPRIFYAANLLAHATAAVLVYAILRLLVRNNWAAWIGAAFFALHPIQVEAVASAWDLYGPLSAAFGLLSVWRYLLYSDQIRSPQAADRVRARWNYAMASFAFVCAMLTKPTVATIPLIVAAIELCLRKRGIWRLVMTLGPWLGAAAWVAWLDQQAPATARVYVPALWLRPLVALDAIAFYIGKIFVPVRLCMDYGRGPWQVTGRTEIRLTCLIALALLIVAVALRQKLPGFVAAFAIYVVALLPTSGIVPFTFQYYSTVADRYAYLAMLGPALAVGLLLARCPARRAVLASVVLATLSLLSLAQLRHWKDDWTLAAYTVQTNPHAAGGAGIFMYLLRPHEAAAPPAGRALAMPPCTLDASQLDRSAQLLDKGGFSQLATEVRKLTQARKSPSSGG
jgi:hypothetical protein